MKKFTIFMVILFLFAFAMPCFAAECSVEAAFAEKEYSVGDTASISITYDTPHDGGDATIYMSISTKGLSDITLVSADTLICTDVTCTMNHDTDILAFTGSRFTLKEGYSGTIKLSAKVENVKQAEFSAKIEHEGNTVRTKASASVADYQAPTPKPTAKPTPKPTAKPTPKPTAKPENTPETNTAGESKTENNGSTAMPSTGAEGSAAFGVIMCSLGALSLVTLKRKEK